MIHAATPGPGLSARLLRAGIDASVSAASAWHWRLCCAQTSIACGAASPGPIAASLAVFDSLPC